MRRSFPECQGKKQSTTLFFNKGVREEMKIFRTQGSQQARMQLQEKEKERKKDAGKMRKKIC